MAIKHKELRLVLNAEINDIVLRSFGFNYWRTMDNNVVFKQKKLLPPDADKYCIENLEFFRN